MLVRKDIKGILVDLDGTIYRGNRLIDGATKFLDWIRCRNIEYLLLTNNSTTTPEKIVNNLNFLGIQEMTSRIMTSALATAQYLLDIGAKNAKVFIIGENGLFQALIDQGFLITEEHPDYVVVGLDRNVDMSKLSIGFTALLHGAKFILTNPDKILPVEGGVFVPGAGSISALLEYATGLSPIIIGKPHPLIYQIAARKLGYDPKELIIIGDSLETDIKGGQALGISTCLVITGVTSREQLDESNIKPDYVVNSLSDLIGILPLHNYRV
jgi:4-nitrophenyl phosphatase